MNLDYYIVPNEFPNGSYENIFASIMQVFSGKADSEKTTVQNIVRENPRAFVKACEVKYELKMDETTICDYTSRVDKLVKLIEATTKTYNIILSK